MFGQSLLSGAFGTALVPDENFGINLYTGTGANQTIGGKIKGAASFNGSSSYITTGFTLPADSTMSFSFWLHPIAFSGDSYIWSDLASSGSGSTRGLDFYINSSGNLLIQILTTTNLTYALGTSALGVWVNLVVTIDGNTVILYKNGSSVASSTTGDSLGTAGPRQVTLGRAGDYNGGYFDGLMDQIRIFDTTLTQSQVTSLYAETASEASTLNFPAGAGCVAAYQFDTNANTVLSQADLDTCNFPTGAGCLALYQFTNNSNDTCGSYNGTDSNITYSNGVFNKAASFNGSSSKISLGNQTFFNAGDYSVSLWLNNQGNDSNYQMIISQRTSSDAGSPINISMYGVSYGSNDGKLYFAVGGSYFASNTVLSKNTWYHLVFTIVAGGNMNIYVDGVLDSNSTTESTTRPTPTTQNLAIGANGSNTDYPFNGLIDQVRFFNTALTQSQVTELARGEPKYNGTPSSVSFNGWVGFKPDLTWIKKRNGGTGNNLLQNTVNGTGTGSSLSSNSDTAAGNFDQYGYLSSFNEQGFTTQGGSSGSYPYDNLGESGSGYVSWNWKAGADTYAGYFNGSSTKITTDYTTNDSEFSISAWVYYRGNPASQYNYIASKGFYSSSSNTNYFAFQTYFSQYPELRVRLNNSTNVGATSSVGLSAGKWYHLVGTCDSSGNLKIYVNGSETGSASGAPARSMGQAMIIGQYFDGSWASGFFKGEINNFRYFNQAISASEVTSLYNEGLSDNNTLDFPAGAGCTAAWPLNGSTDPLSGSSMSGTPIDLKFVKSGYTGRNNDGTVESQVSANPDYGFSIVKYNPNDTVGMTVGHGLQKSPQLVITKRLDGSQDWGVYTNVSTGNTTTNWLSLNDTDAYGAGSYMTLNPTTLELPQTGAFWSTASSNQIAYCWHSVAKYSKIGSYTGNGSATGPTVSTGFRPTWLMVKRTDSTSWWNIQDDKRDPVNPRIHVLGANDASAEINSSNYAIDFNDNGFQILNSFGDWNASGGTYIYITFA
jgi:hypothetical protein